MSEKNQEGGNKICALDRSIGQKMKYYLKTKNLRNEDAWAALGASDETFSSLRVGRRPWSAFYIEKITEFLGIKIWQLFYDKEELADEPEIKAAILTRDVTQALDLYKKLSASNKKVIKAMMDTLIKEQPDEKITMDEDAR